MLPFSNWMTKISLPSSMVFVEESLDVIICNIFSVWISCGVSRSRSICDSALLLVNIFNRKRNCFQHFTTNQYHDKKTLLCLINQFLQFHFKSRIKSIGKHFMVGDSQDVKKAFFNRNHSNIKYGCHARMVELSKKYICIAFKGLQSSTLLKIKTPSWRLCVKNAKRQASSDPYFSVYGENCITRLR